MVNHLVNKYSEVISQIETELLLCGIFKCTREELYLDNMAVDDRAKGLCDSLIQRRLAGEPIQYITSTAQFMGLDFIVNKNTFIPRPETEILVNEVFRFLIHNPRFTNRNPKILDLCTGCGNIAISLARLMDNVEIVATDISDPALKIAKENSIIHEVDKGITFYRRDLFQALPFDKKYKFDIIVCNPPYIRSSELDFLQREVRCEPRIALHGGPDGLGFYRRIAESAPTYLKTEGSLFLEIGFGQTEDAIDIFCSKKIFEIKKIKKDLAEIDRMIWINLL